MARSLCSEHMLFTNFSTISPPEAAQEHREQVLNLALTGVTGTCPESLTADGTPLLIGFQL